MAFTPKGYAHVSLSIKQRITHCYVHHLVARAFLPPRPKGTQLNHKDGVKQNNRLKNLEYLTPKENVRHAMRLGLCPHMEKTREK